MMMRKSVLAVMVLALCLPPMARAKDSIKKALAPIPADAAAFILVPSIEQADADFQRTINRLGLGMMPYFQPPMNSISGLLGQFLQMREGLDTSGSLAVVLMPFDKPNEFMTRQALVIPTTNAKTLLQSMGGTAGEGDMWTVGIMGQPHQAVALEKHIVLSVNPGLAKSIADAEKGLAKTLDKSELDALEELDLAIWINGELMISKFRQQIDQFVQMLSAMQAAQQPGMAKTQEEQLKMFFDGMARGIMGISLDEPGLGLRFMMTMKPESEMAKMYRIETTTKSLLRGLPAGEYVGAFGQVIDPEQTKVSFKKGINPYVEMLKAQEGMDAEKIDRMRDWLEDWAVLWKGIRGSLVATEPGPEGLFACNLVFETTDSEKWMELTRKMVGELLAWEVTNEDVKKVVGLISHQADAEEIGGVKMDHLKVDLWELARKEEAPEEDVANLKKVLGQEGLVFRMGAVDKKTAIVCLGGKKSTGLLIERAASNDAPLDKDAGIEKVSAHLPKERQSVGYLSLDNTVKLVRNITDAMGEEMFPLQVPPINAPLALAGSGGKNWMQVDVLLPTDLMIAGKNAAMMMMGTMGAAQQGQQEPPPES